MVTSHRSVSGPRGRRPRSPVSSCVRDVKAAETRAWETWCGLSLSDDIRAWHAAVERIGKPQEEFTVRDWNAVGAWAGAPINRQPFAVRRFNAEGHRSIGLLWGGLDEFGQLLPWVKRDQPSAAAIVGEDRVVSVSVRMEKR